MHQIQLCLSHVEIEIILKGLLLLDFLLHYAHMFSSLMALVCVFYVTVGTTNAKCVLKIVEFTVTEHGTVS